MELCTPPEDSSRSTRIVATLGPASSEARTIGALISAGADVLRLNLSHGDHDSHRTAFRRVREAAVEAGRPVAVLADLCGPKIRVGQLLGGDLLLRAGDAVTVTTGARDTQAVCIPVTYDGFCHNVTVGASLLIDDGLLELRVQRVRRRSLDCTVVRGGRLVSGKSVNAPGTELGLSSLTAKDRLDTAFALSLGVELVALSFVRSADDVNELRRLVTSLCPSSPPMIVAKIETPQALQHIDAILAAADAIMVARGDLGVEIGCERVPTAQADLVARANAVGKPVIVATQMLESMVHSAVPTRAEVADIAQAVASGADATMLSAETASGDFPVEAVATMARIATFAEDAGRSGRTHLARPARTAASLRPVAAIPPARPRTVDRTGYDATDPRGPNQVLVALARLTGELATAAGASAIVVFGDGDTVRAVAAASRHTPILAPGGADHRSVLRAGMTAGADPLAPVTDAAGLVGMAAAHIDATGGAGAPIVAVVQHDGSSPGDLSVHLVATDHIRDGRGQALHELAPAMAS